LRSPHLVLTYVRGYDGVALQGDGRLQRLHQMLWQNTVVALGESQAVLRAPLADSRPPRVQPFTCEAILQFGV
jgi:hypothetical protein